MLHTLGFSLILVGFTGILFGIVGMIRFPNFFTKIHAASVIDCASIPLVLVGLSMLQKNHTNSLKLIFIIFLILLLNPVISNMTAKIGLIINKPDNNSEL